MLLRTVTGAWGNLDVPSKALQKPWYLEAQLEDLADASLQKSLP